MKFGELRVYCLELALTNFGHDPRRRESARPCGSFVFLSGKQRTTLLISAQPNFTKFAHKTWFCEVVKPFGIIFWKFALKWSFFRKNRDHRQRFPTSSRDFSETITNLGKSRQVGAPMESWLSIDTVGINSKWFPWPVARAHGEQLFSQKYSLRRPYETDNSPIRGSNPPKPQFWGRE